MLTFGPVPSRRLGRSLGINNIPPKTCTYSCIYCQVGRTDRMTCTRREFYPPTDILDSVHQRLADIQETDTPCDYATFVPDGEPTLDMRLGESIQLLHPLACKIAVITNASLLWEEGVRSQLRQADWVSVKIDSVQDATWRRINRPHRKLHMNTVLKGIDLFSQDFSGTLVTETMLVRDVNDDEEGIDQIGRFLERISPACSYLSIPMRPPAEEWVHAPREAELNRAYQILATHVDRVEYLIDYEGDAFHVTSRVEEDLLDISAVHPIREDAVENILDRSGADLSVVNNLVHRGLMKEVVHAGHRFYVRRFSHKQ